MRNKPELKNQNRSRTSFKYNYVVSNGAPIRLVNLQAAIGVLLAIYGVSEFLKLSIWYAIIFGPLITLVLTSNILSHLINLFYPEFNLNKHTKFIRSFWKENAEPSIDVFLPVAGEDIKTIRSTWEGVASLEYDNYKVYVLDDKNDPDVALMATEFGFNYLTRPNRGEYKKAGNLEYGYSKSSGEFVIVFDADFRPIPEALYETVPYIASDKKMSILQTPQYFETTKEVHDRSNIEYGAGVVVEDFYRVTMPSKMRFGLAMCVGTSVLYRRRIIEEVGIPRVDHTEDLRQGLMTLKKGYHIGYLPIIISRGVCPDNLQTYYKQQSRWAYGCLEATISPFFRNSKLDNWTKLYHFSSTLYYLAEAIAPLLSFQILALLYFNTNDIRITWVWPFVVYLSYQLFTKHWVSINPIRLGTYLAGNIQCFTYAESLVRYLLGRPIGWQVSNAKAQKGRQLSNNYWLNNTLSTVFIAIYQVLLGLIIVARPEMLLNWETYIVLIVALWRAFLYIHYNLVSNWFVNSKLIIDMKDQFLRLKLWQLTTFVLVIGSTSWLLSSIVFGFMM